MERFSKFRRSKKDSAGATSVAADDKTAAASRTSSPSDPDTAAAAPATAHQVLLTAAAPERRRDRHSPFRGLHLRTSTKRARSSPPAALPQSPTSASAHPGLFINTDIAGIDQYQNASPLSTVQHAVSATVPKRQDFPRPQRSQSQSRARKRQPGSGAGGPQIPSFLTLSLQEIENKFQDLTWLERERMLQSAQNPAPTFQFARVPSQVHVKRLDRYVNVQPWQNNRVRLQVPPGKPDYINASPICLSTTTGGPLDQSGGGVEDHPSRYIAMQGPKRNSVEHVWRMVFEQLRSPAVIVMLTETHEGLAEKCYPYFPHSPDSPPIEIGASDEFADGFRASVRCEAIEPTCAGDAIELRKLVIRVHRRAGSPAAGAPATPLRMQRQNSSNGEGGSRKRGVESEATSPIETTQEDDDDVMIMSPFKPDPPAGRSIFPSLKKRRDRSQPRQGSSRSSSRASARTGGDRTPAESTDREENGIEEEDESEPAEVEERVVHHFLYKKWPDFGVPALEDLNSFFTLMRLSREKNADPENPRIVHCSAGVGRSGTFIALEHLMRELDLGVLEDWDDQEEERAYTGDGGAGDGDLIFHTVNQLREQRRNMVQAEGQFLFIYQVLRKLWQDKYDVPEEEQEPAAKRHEVDPFVSSER
ncbi:hypothetical protein RB595_007734 [Gaeumannomyces hyphopodioides]